MKTINAYQNVKDFSQRIEFINSSLRTEGMLGQLKTSKDLFVIIGSLKMAEAVKSMNERFQIEEREATTFEDKDVLVDWGIMLTETEGTLSHLTEKLDQAKDILDKAIACYTNCDDWSESKVETCKESAKYMLRAVKVFSQGYSLLKYAVAVFEEIILPKMTAEELKPEIQIPENYN